MTDLLDVFAAPQLLLTLGVLIAVAITQTPFVRAVLREQRRERVLREEKTTSRIR